MTVRFVALSSIADVFNGKTPAKSEQRSEGHPVLKIRNVDENGSFKGEFDNFVDQSLADRFRQKWIQAGDTLILNAAHNADYVGSKTFFAGESVVDSLATGEWLVVRPAHEHTSPDYVNFWLRSRATRDAIRFIVKGIHLYPKDVAQLEIPLPPLPEQRRLVDLLSRAEGIVRLRREAQPKAAELIPALFLDMFGDPASNPKGWPVEELGQYLAIHSSVKTPNLETEANLPCIGADSIESGTGKIISWPTVEEIRPISGKYFFEKGDVLYSKIRPALRKAILAPSNGYCSADMYPLRPAPGRATPEFVAALLLSKAFTDYALGVSMRAQMPKVNRETLFAYKAPLPPIELQHKFAAKAEAVRAIAAQQSAALATAQATFDALLHQFFQP